MMSKLQEVADLAKVSKATVSRVINNHENVSATARQRVLEAMRKLNLNANEMKRSNEGTMMIGLVLPLTSSIAANSFGMDILLGVEEKAFEKDYMVLIGNSSGLNKEKAVVSQMIARDVEGIILLSKNQQSDHLHLLKQSGIPSVLVDQKVEGENLHLVRGDNLLGAMNLTNYLFSIGHSRIAMVTPSRFSTYRDRIRGFQIALLEKGMETGSDRLIDLDEAGMTIAEAMRAILNRSERPTAIFIAHPGDLLVAVQMINEYNLRIPEDISLVTFDDEYTPLPAEYVDYFTSITQPAKVMGSIAVELLFQQIKEPGIQGQEIVLPGALNIRQSTCARV
ncbi:LacI family DNA-binding transcriptional regulator [Paenibacillus sp. J2TS4]|uniref:LacI family DNA-binding transcriptional regulator n=1 Tax=Paenibacillus sp. J2TS4 TaxID=2807194 RepID=UPI001B2869EB|nr:LacI family DNA-binding transcriptional regulator [Paenibacillus sp. J2TS4]GIP31463.1 LacI family transcriptional regulator [Paenibacillus sp. J2TS4]